MALTIVKTTKKYQKKKASVLKPMMKYLIKIDYKDGVTTTTYITEKEKKKKKTKSRK